MDWHLLALQGPWVGEYVGVSTLAKMKVTAGTQFRRTKTGVKTYLFMREPAEAVPLLVHNFFDTDKVAICIEERA